ncbi:MAG: DUF4062 domain-containing protein [Candidatus Aminicenantes bacterium]|nr:DUF4062 domain-containing protein [Candidatus Aminicenantes bacterium]
MKNRRRSHGSSEKKYPNSFFSSIAEDLKPYRQAARDVAIRARFLPEMQEYFASEGKHPPLEECLKKVDSCDVLIVIVAYRYGWIPENQPAGESKSITWLECERARSKNKEVLVFLVDSKYEWAETLKEEYRLIQALRENKLTPELSSNVQLAVEKLKQFKSWLNQLGVRANLAHHKIWQPKYYKSSMNGGNVIPANFQP